jgi:hypothetical protein
MKNFMNSFITLSLAFLLFINGLPFSAFAGDATPKQKEAVESLFLGATPEMKLYEVLSIMTQNWRRGALNKEQENLLAKNKTDLSDMGPIAQVLAGRGYNYLVLHYLRSFLNQEVLDIPTIMGTSQGLEPAGIPEFMLLDKEEAQRWQVDITGILKFTYDPEVFTVLQRNRLLIDKTMTAANVPVEGMGQILKELFADRYKSTRSVVEFANVVEAVLTQYQGLLITLKLKEKRYENDMRKRYALQTLQDAAETEKDEFLKKISSVLDLTEIQYAKKAPWTALAKAIQASKASVVDLKKQFADIAIKNIRAIDKIEETAASTDKYQKDTPWELENYRLQHQKQFEDFAEEWNKISTYEYFKRKDRWRYTHYHSEEHGPYLTQEDYMKEKDVFFTYVPPEREEASEIEFLKNASYRINSLKLEEFEIADLKGQIQSHKANHAAYAKGRSTQSHDKRENFIARNALIQKWFDSSLDAIERQLAQEKIHYIGVEFSGLKEKYADVMARLKNQSDYIHKIKVYTLTGIGSASVIGAGCWYYFSSIAGQ